MTFSPKKLLILLAIIGLAFFAKLQLSPPPLVSLSGKTMGTTYHVKYLNDKDLNDEEVHQKIDELLQIVNKEMSTFMPTSDISRFNQHHGTTPFAIPKDFAYVVKTALELNKTTLGALDITIGPLVNIWNFGPTKRNKEAPTNEKIAETLKIIGIEKLKLIEEDGHYFLQKTEPQLYLDLSAIAKGFGVDKVANYLADLGLKNYMVEIGGEVFAQGKNDRQKTWTIGIESPNYEGGRSVEEAIQLDGLGMATSGNYRNYFEQNGKRFTHELDPKLGYPVQHRLASITVVAENTTVADGLSTGLIVLGEEKAFQVAEKNNIAAYLIIQEGEGFKTQATTAFKKLMEKKQ